jgi:cathepsin L
MRETNQFYTGEEYQARFGIWMSNKRIVQEHNGANLGFTLAVNKLAHLTPAEYRSLLGFRMNKAEQKAAELSSFKASDSVDWRQKGVVNPVKDQAQCGSCWAFSTVQGQESAWAIAKGQLLSLSEQNLVDCVTSCYGCNGGLMTSAFTYVISKQAGKWNTEDDYPYTAKDGKCQFNAGKGVSFTKSYVNVAAGSESDLAAKVESMGPACIAIDASHYSFQLYNGGVYDEKSCSPRNLDHGVGCVGFGVEGSVKYWIVRNSWGQNWGEKGYIRMVKDKSNQCGEATMACLPIVQ